MQFPAVLGFLQRVRVVREEAIPMYLRSSRHGPKPNIQEQTSRFIGVIFAMLPPLIPVGSQFSRRIFRAHWMAGVEVSSLGVASKAKTDCILGRVRAAVRFLHDVMNVDAAPPKLMTNATPTM